MVVDGTTAYVGHTVRPEATTMIDVSDPARPRQIAEIKCNHQGFRGGQNITDVTDPANPKHIYFWECDGSGVHRFTFDGRYAYISPEIEGYVCNIVMILDLKDPKNLKKLVVGICLGNGSQAANCRLGKETLIGVITPFE